MSLSSFFSHVSQRLEDKQIDHRFPGVTSILRGSAARLQVCFQHRSVQSSDKSRVNSRFMITCGKRQRTPSVKRLMQRSFAVIGGVSASGSRRISGEPLLAGHTVTAASCSIMACPPSAVSSGQQKGGGGPGGFGGLHPDCFTSKDTGRSTSAEHGETGDEFLLQHEQLGWFGAAGSLSSCLRASSALCPPSTPTQFLCELFQHNKPAEN